MNKWVLGTWYINRLDLFVFWPVLKEFTTIGMNLRMTKANNCNLQKIRKWPVFKAKGKTYPEQIKPAK